MFARALLSFHHAPIPPSNENSANSNHSRTYEQFSRKSNHSRTYGTPGVGESFFHEFLFTGRWPLVAGHLFPYTPIEVNPK
jgi:hypothetical protein